MRKSEDTFETHKFERLSHIFEIPSTSNENLVFQSKYLVFQSKCLVFRSKTVDFDLNTRYFQSEILKYKVFTL